MQGLLRIVQLLTMVVWVGGLIFFAFLLAPIAFHTLPSIHEAGLLVGAVLHPFHIVGLVCGALFCAATALIFRSAPMRARGRYELEFVLAVIMLAATAYLQVSVLPTMDHDRDSIGAPIESVPKDNPARAHFDRLHVRSERVEGLVLFVGLGVIFLMSREQLPLED